MVARYAGASLGLFAFFVAVVGGILADNPPAVTLSRGILALLTFCLIGMLLGAAAQLVVDEHQRQRETAIRDRCRAEADEPLVVGGTGVPPSARGSSVKT
ncbi:MAG: hypothetical protein AABZ12_01985 [Planctomycetota bacterium]